MKKKSHSIFAVLALALVIAAAIVVFALIRKYTPSKEHEDLTTYYHLTNSDEVAIVLNNEVTSSKARVIDGHIYIDYDFVHDNLNSRFYWDSMIFFMVCTSVTEMIIGNMMAMVP